MKKSKQDKFKIKQIRDAYSSGYIEGYKALAFEILMDLIDEISIEKLQEKLKEVIES